MLSTEPSVPDPERQKSEMGSMRQSEIAKHRRRELPQNR